MNCLISVNNHGKNKTILDLFDVHTNVILTHAHERDTLHNTPPNPRSVFACNEE